ncbi:T9SS type A sorting domain-containing protein, partial [bacterium]|nr:T9SS type A sorting domain-containing protein [bacterium]
PRRQADLIEGSGPVVDNVNCNDWTPLSGDAITVTATITDDVMVTGATLYFRDDSGDSTGVFSSAVMSTAGGDTWSGVIAAPHNERQVDFYISADDGDLNTTFYPANAPAGWLEVAIGFTSIYDVQYADPSLPGQNSAYYGRVVNLTGIVTVGTGDAGAASKFLMQDAAGAFNGILVYESSSGNYVLAGDEVEVGGYIDDYYGLTEMAPHSASAVEILTFSNDLFAPAKVHCGILNDDTLDDGDDVFGEAYESVWVTTFGSTVVDTVGADQYNTFKISDAPGDTLVVDAIVDLIYVAQMGDVVGVTGFMDYAYGVFELVPLQDEAIVVASATGVEDELPQILPAGGFSRIAPNPFNPKTEIRFVLTRDNLTQLNIYSIRGELVRTLASGRLESGEHIVNWDGNDFSGQKVSSGTYFARLRIGSEVLQVRKLMLVK